MKRRGEKPCAEGPIKFAHLCEIDARTKLGTEAWWALNGSGARRVDAIRALHAVTDGHGDAQSAVTEYTNHSNLKNLQTRTIVRVVKEINADQA